MMRCCIYRVTMPRCFDFKVAIIRLQGNDAAVSTVDYRDDDICECGDIQTQAQFLTCDLLEHKCTSDDLA
jgi:hypothetical protein